MFDNCKTINKFINNFDEYGNFKKNILTEDKNVSINKLKKLPTYPSQHIMDNNIY